MSLPYTRTNEGVYVLCNGESHVVRREHLAWKQIMEAVNNGDSTKFLSLLNPVKVVEKLVSDVKHGSVSYQNGTIYINSVPVDKSDPALGKVYRLFLDRIEGHLRDGLTIKPLLAFIGNYLQNPSLRSIEQAYDFIERNNLPITEDGYFLAYKSVQNNYLDKHSGTINNTPGTTVSIPRNKVDDNPNSHCSHGLHVGALEYSGPNGWYNSSGDKVIIVKVNPRDIVSVPSDHNCRKCRVCEYYVQSDYGSNLDSRLYSSEGEEITPEYYDGVDACDISELREDDEIVFQYNGKTRRGIVSYLDEYLGNVTVILADPEPEKGEYRSFKWNKMSDVRILG